MKLNAEIQDCPYPPTPYVQLYADLARSSRRHGSPHLALSSLARRRLSAAVKAMSPSTRPQSPRASSRPASSTSPFRVRGRNQNEEASPSLTMVHSGGRGSYCLVRILGMHTTCSMKCQREIETTFFDDLNSEEDVTFDPPAKHAPRLIDEPPFDSEEEIRMRELLSLQLEATDTFDVPSLRILARQALEIPAFVAAPAHVPSIREPPKGLVDGVRPEVRLGSPHQAAPSWQRITSVEHQLLSKAPIILAAQKEKIWCPICKEGEVKENSRLIYCNRCQFQLKRGDEVNLVPEVNLPEEECLLVLEV